MYTNKELVEYIESQPHNYDNPETHANSLVPITLVFVIVSISCVALRIYARTLCPIKLKNDDLLAMVAVFPVVGLATTVILGSMRYGWDRHIYDISPTLVVPNAKIAYVAKILYVVSATLIRASALFLFKRLHDGFITSPYIRRIYAVQIVNLLLGVSAIFLQATICVPLSDYWSFLTRDSAHCRPDNIVTLTHGAVFCLLNFVVCSIPLPVLYRVRKPLNERLRLMALFSSGIIAAIVSVVREYFIYMSLFKNKDQTWYGYYFWIAVIIEVNLGLICAGVPAYQALVPRPAKAKKSYELESRRTLVLQPFHDSRGSRESDIDSTSPLSPLKPAHTRSFDNTHRRERDGYPDITEDGDIIGATFRLESEESLDRYVPVSTRNVLE